MPSQLTLQALEVHERLSYLQIVPCPVKWSPSKRKWTIPDVSTNYKAKRSFWLTVFLQVVAVFGCFTALYFCLDGSYIKYENESLFGCIVSLVFSLAGLLVNSLMWFYGLETIYMCNIRYNLDNKQDLAKDWVGSTVLSLCFTFQFFTAFTVIFGSFCNWDPVYVLINGACVASGFNTINFVTITLEYFSGLSGKVLRAIILTMFGQQMAVCIRTVYIIGLTSGAAYLAAVDRLILQKLSSSTMKFYSQLSLDRQILRDCEKLALMSALGGGGLILNLGVAGVEVGIFKERLLITASAASLTSIFILSLYLTLNICCSFNDKAIQAIAKWKMELIHGHSYGYRSRVLRSLKPLAVPVGNVGIINKELKTNFFYSELMYTVNMIIAIKEFVQ